MLIGLLARFISVGLPVSLLKLKDSYSPHVIKILTWGGLRGGISVALVLFSILVQGLTVGRVAAMAKQ